MAVSTCTLTQGQAQIHEVELGGLGFAARQSRARIQARRRALTELTSSLTQSFGFKAS